MSKARHALPRHSHRAWTLLLTGLLATGLWAGTAEGAFGYVVRPGDTLSQIARAHGLGSWKPLFALNRGVVGANPNLIFPGQSLRLTRAAPTVKPRVSRSAARPSTARAVLTGAWRQVAMCESGLNPRALNPGGKYRGLFQFDYPTWRSVGGSGDPAAASVAEQLKRAKLLYAARGAQPWPECGRFLR